MYFECVKAGVWLRMQENVTHYSHLLVAFLNCRGRGKGANSKGIKNMVITKQKWNRWVDNEFNSKHIKFLMMERSAVNRCDKYKETSNKSTVPTTAALSNYTACYNWNCREWMTITGKQWSKQKRNPESPTQSKTRRR